ncbi:anti-sigma-D factor RsdA [Gordonia sp. ABSL1-1]|uniref:anti-sigma-D factor RsdA n=1 Tax=Gordonia sp. ABSL1-1 TaxID=3053923 RepID=UPI002572F937|nr:anti-sigma-D factor RsdA [Gordonia sp. ABSL1-1]MDL9938305.1 anti-sigma-D factor RsdA [Gordonia sp. ABSL1-1]
MNADDRQPWRRGHDGRFPQPPSTTPSDDVDAGDPVDIAAISLDDQFLDALSRDVPVPTRDDAEYELAALLSGWRHEVVGTPAPELPTVEEVERAIAATERAGRGKRIVRHLRVVSGAAAVVIVAAAGLTVLSQGAQPGDPLWGVKKVVFAEAASETQASYDVRNNLERAQEAISSGRMDEAASLIQKAESQMGPVRSSDTREQMGEWIKRLRAEATPTTITPGAPSSSTLPGNSTEPLPGTSSQDPRLLTTGPSTTRPDDRSSAPSETTEPSTPESPTPPSSTVPTTKPTPTQTKPTQTKPTNTTPTTSAEATSIETSNYPSKPHSGQTSS